MKHKLTLSCLAGILAGSALWGQSNDVTREIPLANPPAVRYRVTDLGTFGGPFSIAFGVNNAGRVGGAAALSNGNVHPFVTGLGGAKYDLGTLGGPNAQANRPDGQWNFSLVSETSKADPLNEDFCGFGNHLVCLGAFWTGGLTALPTLGGNNAMALGSNDRGQIIGLAETATHDNTCPAPQVLTYEAVMWGPRPGQIQQLPPLAGDTVGFALGVNEAGQATGSSGSCANTVVTAVGLLVGEHAVLWENGTPVDLGSLGGTMGKGGAINNRGEVTGFSSVQGDVSVHSFLWTREKGMQDLGALGTDFLGDPAGINNSTQIVGGSCDETGNCRAFLWEKGVLSDLNDLIARNSPLYLMYGLGINDAGEIVGFALHNDTGEVHAYLATPIPAGAAHAVLPEPQSEAKNHRHALPENIRVMLQQRLPRGRRGR